MENIFAQILRHRERLPLPESKLPTTPEIAKRGARAYGQVVGALSGEAQDIFIQVRDIRRSFVGTAPEEGAEDGTALSGLSGDQINNIREVLQKYAPDMALIDHEWTRDGGESTFSLINLAAAEHIIKNNKADFPQEAQTETRKWIVANHRVWWRPPGENNPDSQKRYGLLSGFTAGGSHFFGRFWELRHEIINKLDMADRSFVADYTNNGYTTNLEHRKKLAEIIDTHLPTISAEDKNLWLNSHRVEGGDAMGGFLGVNIEYDTKYIDSLNEIYKGSGIDNVLQSGNKENSIVSKYIGRFVNVLQKRIKKS